MSLWCWDRLLPFSSGKGACRCDSSVICRYKMSQQILRSNWLVVLVLSHAVANVVVVLSDCFDLPDNMLGLWCDDYDLTLTYATLCCLFEVSIMPAMIISWEKYIDYHASLCWLVAWACYVKVSQAAALSIFLMCMELFYLASEDFIEPTLEVWITYLFDWRFKFTVSFFEMLLEKSLVSLVIPIYNRLEAAAMFIRYWAALVVETLVWHEQMRWLEPFPGKDISPD